MGGHNGTCLRNSQIDALRTDVEDLKDRANRIDVHLLPELGQMHRELDQATGIAKATHKSLETLTTNFALVQATVRNLTKQFAGLAQPQPQPPSDPTAWEDEPTIVRRTRDPKWQADYDARLQAEARLEEARARGAKWKMLAVVLGPLATGLGLLLARMLGH